MREIELLMERFDLLLDAPDSVSKLRQLILDLAVRGKLVDQDPNDEPASALLERIAEERERLVKEGRIKKPKKLPAIDPDEVIFELPAGWEWVRFGTISEIERGGSPRPIKSYLTDAPDGLNWIKIGDTEKGGKYITSTKEKIRKEGLSKTRMVYPGDFLLTNSMSFGRPYITKIEGCIHDGWLRIHPPSSLEKNYLYHLLSSSYVADFFKAAAAGAVVLNLNADKVRDLPIPLPPLPEQRRIVAKVDQLMAMCDELEQQQAERDKVRVKANSAAVQTLLASDSPAGFTRNWQRIRDNFDLLYSDPANVQELRQGILQLAVQGKLVPQDVSDEPASVLLERIAEEKARLVKEGKIKKPKKLPAINPDEVPFEVPAGWVWTRFSSIAMVESNLVDPGDHPDAPHIAPNHIEKGNGKLLNYTTVSEDGVKSPKHKFYAGQILYSKIRPNLSKVIIADFEGLCSADMYPIRSFIYNRYQHIFLLSRAFLEMVVKSDNRVAMPKVNRQGLEKTLISLPPIPEQHRIVAKVDQLLALCDELENVLTSSQNISTGLLEAVVAGVVN